MSYAMTHEELLQYQIDYQKASREANPGQNTARCRAYREANKEKVAARQKAWYEANKKKKIDK